MAQHHNHVEMLLYGLRKAGKFSTQGRRIEKRLLERGYCTVCENTGFVEEVSCMMPPSQCCGGCVKTVKCNNCK